MCDRPVAQVVHCNWSLENLEILLLTAGARIQRELITPESQCSKRLFFQKAHARSSSSEYLIEGITDSLKSSVNEHSHHHQQRDGICDNSAEGLSLCVREHKML